MINDIETFKGKLYILDNKGVARFADQRRVFPVPGRRMAIHSNGMMTVMNSTHINHSNDTKLGVPAQYPDGKFADVACHRNICYALIETSNKTVLYNMTTNKAMYEGITGRTSARMAFNDGLDIGYIASGDQLFKIQNGEVYDAKSQFKFNGTFIDIAVDTNGVLFGLVQVPGVNWPSTVFFRGPDEIKRSELEGLSLSIDDSGDVYVLFMDEEGPDTILTFKGMAANVNGDRKVLYDSLQNIPDDLVPIVGAYSGHQWTPPSKVLPDVLQRVVDSYANHTRL